MSESVLRFQQILLQFLHYYDIVQYLPLSRLMGAHMGKSGYTSGRSARRSCYFEDTNAMLVQRSNGLNSFEGYHDATNQPLSVAQTIIINHNHKTKQNKTTVAKTTHGC